MSLREFLGGCVIVAAVLYAIWRMRKPVPAPSVVTPPTPASGSVKGPELPE